MISVPTSTGSVPTPQAPAPPQIPEAYLMMAAGQMHKEGRLVQSLYGEPDTTGAPGGDKPTPPEEYWPSDGNRKGGPAMMTERLRGPIDTPPDIRKVAPEATQEKAGFFNRLVGGIDSPVHVPDDKKYPDNTDAHFARQFQQTYGDPVAVFDLAGAKTKKLDTDELIDKYHDITGRAFRTVAATKATPDEQDNILKNWIAAQKSPVAALGFDPHVTIHTDTKDEKLNLSGFYRPSIDTLWYDDAHQDAAVHESIHRGIEQLRKAGMLPAETKKAMDVMDSWDSAHGGGEELMVRALMARHFGDIEKSGGNVGDAQVEAGKAWAKHEDIAKGLDALEAAATKLIQQKRPGGPR